MSDAEERKAFEAFVKEWTGKDMAFHAEYRTTGLEFAWAAWQAARSQGWRPISEAPRDGTEILAVKPSVGTVLVRYRKEDPIADRGEGFYEAWWSERIHGLTLFYAFPEPPALDGGMG